MKSLRLFLHSKTFSEESLLINSKDYPSLCPGDIVEIKSSDVTSSPLLLQVGSLSSETPQKGTISIEQSIAASFQLKQYTEVSVKTVENLKDVSLDSVEFTFKDQYLARSDMWRLKTNLVDSCLYLNKKLEFFGIRCQVSEMYIQGEKVASGILTEDTKIVYRSASSMVYLFIQMSCEMWEFDINGDLYFEKAIDGFLPDLFSKWKKLNCNHDVTIVLFSRTFYDAESIDEFPLSMRECLQQDYKGRFFEDFYRVAVQNERYDDWNSTIILLKRLFNEYQEIVLKYHEKAGLNMPRAINSTASQGNFLEVLNMSLNVFEKHYMDRSFDRTGQLSVVITPGVGFFEVDRELTIITKQRIIDNGIGSDLVCLGEEPLHAVPLFRFYNKQLPRNAPSVADDYNMPHWINLSFYSTRDQNIYTNFVPRIKLPTLRPEEFKEKEKGFSHSKRSRHASQPDPSFPVLFDYDEYDRQVFKVSPHSSLTGQTMSLQRPKKYKDTSTSSTTSGFSANRSTEEISRLTASEPAPAYFPYSHSHASSAAINIPFSGQHSGFITSSYQSSTEADNIAQRQYSRDDAESEILTYCRPIVGSDPSAETHVHKQELTKKMKALVNPFNPSQITIKLTSNRRRWTHVFPLGPTGIFMQQHHYQAIPQISAATLISLEKLSSNYESPMQRSSLLSSDFDAGIEFKSSFLSRRETHSSSSNMSFNANDVRSPSSGVRMSSLLMNDTLSIWGTTGEQEWTPATTTGVDWKSLVIPACLPITTDYFPDQRSLQNDYVLSDYSLLPEDIIAENACPRYFQNDDDNSRRSLTTVEVYKELIWQRLQQGFQIILVNKPHSAFPINQVSSSPQFASALFKGQQKNEQLEEYLLSIGRIFHKLNLDGPKITVTQYRPRHSPREIKVHYCYRFHAPDSDTYGVSWVNFTSEKLENYNWNYLDHYICMRGEGEFELKDSLKYWRLRMLLLPSGLPETKKIIEGIDQCDLYNKFVNEDKIQQREGVLKFFEVMNKIRRIAPKKQKIPLNSYLSIRRSSVEPTLLSSARDRMPLFLLSRRSSMGQTNLSSGITSLRDRVSSNRVHDRPRMRSNSARMGARPEVVIPSGRVSPATEADGRITIPKHDHSFTGSFGPEETEDNFPCDIKKLSETVSDQEIIQAMKNPPYGQFISLKNSAFYLQEFKYHWQFLFHVSFSSKDGLNFLSKAGWPSCTFISFEAVSWLMEHVEGIYVEQQAITTFQKFIDRDLICHVSRSKEHPFIYGFYLYYIVSTNEKDNCKTWDKDELSEKEAIYLFEREWIEIELSPPSSPYTIIENYNFPSDEDIWSSPYLLSSKLNFKCCNVQIDNGIKSGRQEWGQLRYQSIYRPYEAFELVVEWMVATGNKAAELVQHWARKCNQYGLQLVPIPSDPFALPFSDDSDPLRGPIFIPLDLSCLIDTAVQSMDEEGLLKLQEKILCKFGFIPYRNPNLSSPPQYVHISGSMFIMLPVRAKENKKVNGKQFAALDLQTINSPHDEYITRHFSGTKNRRRSALNSETDTKIGFLWSWNYMITKRWKNAGTVDENFMRKVMRDFKSFCSNQENRLEEFYKYSDYSQDHSMMMDLES